MPLTSIVIPPCAMVRPVPVIAPPVNWVVPVTVTVPVPVKRPLLSNKLPSVALASSCNVPPLIEVAPVTLYCAGDSTATVPLCTLI
jgi:hypothetical protein